MGKERMRESGEQRLHGLMAEFDSDHAIVAAAKRLRALGYARLDAFTPRPIDALQDILIPKRSSLPRSVLIAGICGGLTGLGVEWFCNAWDYPLNVGGRPPFSLPAFIPICFEMIVLFAALSAFFGTLYRAGFPRLAHPVFAVANFERASLDRFWLFVSAEDANFRMPDTAQLLIELGCLQVIAPPPSAAASTEHAPPMPRGPFKLGESA
jgi:hypothetical protein